MQHALVKTTDRTPALLAMPMLIVALVFSLLLASMQVGSAQESTPSADATPAPDAATPTAQTDTLGDVLMTYDFDAMPQAPMTVRMLRITLAPGANVPMHNHPGIEFDYVESGTLTARTDGTMVTSVDGETSETNETEELGAGSWVMYPEEQGMSFANEGEEDVVLLSAVILSVGSDVETTITYTEGEPSDSDFEGVSFVVLGDGLIQQFPDAPATITIDSLDVSAGEPVPAFSGVAMLSKVSGPMSFEAVEGAVQVTRSATPQLQPNAIPGQEFELNDNDAAFFPSGYEAIDRANTDEPLTLLRLLIQPEGELSNGAAVVSPLAPEFATDDLADILDLGESDPIGVGAVIAINEEEVNVRADATTDSDIVGSYPAGTQFELTDGPVEGETYTWYAVQGVGDLSDVEGWLVTDFMDVIEPAPAGGAQPDDTTDETAEPEAEATEVAADEEADTTGDDELAPGTLVALNEDVVRIREEPNTGAFILNAFDTGTELEIVSGPETNDGFTWYQVEVVGTDVVGWTAVDFFDVVDDEE